MGGFTRKPSGRDSGRSGGRSSGRDSSRPSRSGSSGSRGGYGGARSGPSRYTSRGTGQGRSTRRADKVEMHETICDKCAKKCEVPFKPTANKPVYCSDCFVKDDSRSGGADSRGKPNQFEQINAKLDKIMKALNI
ncbi:MAG: hypothetical protein KJ771_05275 [Nanoarchaeota archaeon]|nr:hypothetical protein [Nanoarchaeota archaeon]